MFLLIIIMLQWDTAFCTGNQPVDQKATYSNSDQFTLANYIIDSTTRLCKKITAQWYKGTYQVIQGTAIDTTLYKYSITANTV